MRACSCMFPPSSAQFLSAPFLSRIKLAFSSPIGYRVSRCVARLRVTTSDRNPSVFAIAPFTIFLGWVASLTAGHTKRESIFLFPLNRRLISRLQVSPQMPSSSLLMRLEMPSVSLCGSHSTAHGRFQAAILPTELTMSQEPHPVGCHYCHQSFFCSGPSHLTIPVLA